MRHRAAPYLFVAGYVVLLLAVGVGPSVFAVAKSFESSGIYSDGGFAGFANYIAALTDGRFWTGVVNVGMYIAIWVPAMLIGATGLALLLAARVGRSGALIRLAYFLPGAFTGSASVILWLFLLDPSVSPFQSGLHLLGFESSSDILRSSNLAWIFALIAFTTGVGNWVVIFYGALTSINQEVLDAASVDGASEWRKAFSIKIPMISKYITYLLIMTFALGVQVFAEPQIIYQTTSQSVGTAWWSVNQFAYYTAFQRADFGISSAVSVLLLLVGIGGAFVVIRYLKFFETEVAK